MKSISSFSILFLTLLGSLFGAEQPFVMSYLQGQLGNQCFEIAATLTHAWDNGARPLFLNLANDPRCGIPVNREQVFWRIDASPAYIEKAEFSYLAKDWVYEPIPYHPNMLMCGYFQSEKYFRKYKDTICALFAPKPEIVNYLTNKYGHILSHPKTVSIHVRTYPHDPKHQFWTLNGRGYVEKAVAHFDPDSLFVVFSDNIPWCKKYLQGVAKNMIYIEREAHYHDFYLMSFCQHNIISNSTFSWWAAYLNKNPDKIVIAPKKWIQSNQKVSEEIIPEEWIVEE